MLTLLRCKFFIKSSMTSEVNQGHKKWPFWSKIRFFFFFCFCYWLIKKQMPLNIIKEKSLTYTKWHLPCFDLNLRSYGQLFVEQKGLTSDYNFGYYFPPFFSLLKKEGRRKDEWIAKIVIKSHAFLLDLFLKGRRTKTSIDTK